MHDLVYTYSRVQFIAVISTFLQLQGTRLDPPRVELPKRRWSGTSSAPRTVPRAKFMCFICKSRDHPVDFLGISSFLQPDTLSAACETQRGNDSKINQRGQEMI